MHPESYLGRGTRLKFVSRNPEYFNTVLRGLSTLAHSSTVVTSQGACYPDGSIGSCCERHSEHAGDEEVHYVSCGSYLGYQDTYAEDKMFAPGKLGSPRIRFNGLRDRHDVHISI